MTPHPSDPLATMRWTARTALRLRLRRAWRTGLADRHRAQAADLRVGLVGRPVVAVERDGLIAAVRFAGGEELRAGPCHPATVAALEASAARGPVHLVRAAHHGRCWGLYFAGPDGDRLALLAGAVHLAGGGGVRPPAVPAGR